MKSKLLPVAFAAIFVCACSPQRTNDDVLTLGDIRAEAARSDLLAVATLGRAGARDLHQGGVLSGLGDGSWMHVDADGAMGLSGLFQITAYKRCETTDFSSRLHEALLPAWSLEGAGATLGFVPDRCITFTRWTGSPLHQPEDPAAWPSASGIVLVDIRSRRAAIWISGKGWKQTAPIPKDKLMSLLDEQ